MAKDFSSGRVCKRKSQTSLITTNLMDYLRFYLGCPSVCLLAYFEVVHTSTGTSTRIKPYVLHLPQLGCLNWPAKVIKPTDSEYSCSTSLPIKRCQSYCFDFSVLLVKLIQRSGLVREAVQTRTKYVRFKPLLVYIKVINWIREQPLNSTFRKLCFPTSDKSWRSEFKPGECVWLNCSSSFSKGELKNTK